MHDWLSGAPSLPPLLANRRATSKLSFNTRCFQFPRDFGLVLWNRPFEMGMQQMQQIEKEYNTCCHTSNGYRATEHKIITRLDVSLDGERITLGPFGCLCQMLK